MHLNLRTGMFGAAVAVCALAAVSLPAQAEEHGGSWNLNLGASDQASAADVGLPVYPGAWPRKDKDGDDSAARVWAVLNSAGFKVAVLKLASNDAPGRVAEFYHPALVKYGPILDCTGRSSGVTVGDHHGDKLTCDGDKPKPGELIFKAGTDRDQHIVIVRPNGRGSEIDLVFVQIKGFD